MFFRSYLEVTVFDKGGRAHCIPASCIHAGQEHVLYAHSGRQVDTVTEAACMQLIGLSKNEPDRSCFVRLTMPKGFINIERNLQVMFTRRGIHYCVQMAPCPMYWQCIVSGSRSATMYTSDLCFSVRHCFPR